MSIHVYIFDDDELIRTTLTYFVEQEGFQVSSFAQPDHCSVYYSDECMCPQKSACSDIIITDVNMPGVSGLNFIENQIRKGCKVKHIAVMSGDWTDPGLKMAKEWGCQVFYKPFSILKLKKWLDAIREDLAINQPAMTISTPDLLKKKIRNGDAKPRFRRKQAPKNSD